MLTKEAKAEYDRKYRKKNHARLKAESDAAAARGLKVVERGCACVLLRFAAVPRLRVEQRHFLRPTRYQIG